MRDIREQLLKKANMQYYLFTSLGFALVHLFRTKLIQVMQHVLRAE